MEAEATKMDFKEKIKNLYPGWISGLTKNVFEIGEDLGIFVLEE